ncbi:hypothetical protein LTR66_001799 [Elasticomyces elasticus]|nr:hypothetical protein LTR66_001799 [Elasticomyces elasticus]
MSFFQAETTPRPKCYFTHNVLPAYIDEKQPPTKRKPFSSIIAQPFSHTVGMRILCCVDRTNARKVDLLLPAELYDTIREKLHGDACTLKYARVNMKLGELIEGDFFNHYIKTGITFGRLTYVPGVDNEFSLRDGILRLELDRTSYEKAGLVGKPIAHHGRKHVKQRYAVELNLRLPSMVHGKKGFARIEWACKNVLDRSLTWLFYDMRGVNDGTGPISTHHPIVQTISPIATRTPNTKTPTFPTTIEDDDEDTATDLAEWLGLAILASPRIAADDKIDPYLSRYALPDLIGRDNNNNNNSTANPPHTVEDLIRLTWHGFATAPFVSSLFTTAVKASVGEAWFALSVSGFRDEAYLVLKTGRTAMVWEYP